MGPLSSRRIASGLTVDLHHSTAGLHFHQSASVFASAVAPDKSFATCVYNWVLEWCGGDSGSGTAEELEQRVPLIFERASKWNALLFLDEADVFLEQRSIGDINRKALVCDIAAALT